MIDNLKELTFTITMSAYGHFPAEAVQNLINNCAKYETSFPEDITVIAYSDKRESGYDNHEINEFLARAQVVKTKTFKLPEQYVGKSDSTPVDLSI